MQCTRAQSLHSRGANSILRFIIYDLVRGPASVRFIRAMLLLNVLKSHRASRNGWGDERARRVQDARYDFPSSVLVGHQTDSLYLLPPPPPQSSRYCDFAIREFWRFMRGRVISTSAREVTFLPVSVCLFVFGLCVNRIAEKLLIESLRNFMKRLYII